MILKANSLKGTYKCYVLRRAKQWVSEIPEWKRQEFAELIRLRNCFLGCRDKDILETVLGYLTGKEGK